MNIKKVKVILKLIRIDEVLLVLPYSIMASFASRSGVPNIKTLILLILATMTGFFAGNIFNAIADKDIDAQNPRTSNRPLVKNEFSPKETVVLLIIDIIVLLICTALIRPFYLILLPIPVTICLGYSLCKRFTWLCHFVLGVAHAICPVSGWMIFGKWTDWRMILLGAIVFFWTIALDMIYSSQDIEYDRMCGTYSIPAVFGKKVAYSISVICYFVVFLLFIVFICVTNCGVVCMVLFALAELVLLIQYIFAFVRQGCLKYVLILNQIYSVLLLSAVVVDKVV